MLQTYTMSIQKFILMNTRLFQMLKKERWVINMILLTYFLKHINIMSGLKIKNRLIKHQEKVIKTDMQIYFDMPPLEGDDEGVKEE